MNNKLSLFDDSLFDTLTRGFYHKNPLSSSLLGAVEIQERDGCEYLSLDIPGFKQSDLDISFVNGVIDIKAKNKQGRTYNYCATLGEGYDPDKMEAKIEDGVLEIKLVEKEKPPVKKIQVK